MSGIDATVAGVLAASLNPIRKSHGAPDAENSPLYRLKHGLQPWFTFVIVPIFGFANAGVAIGGFGAGRLMMPLPLGVAAGLFAGKQVRVRAAVLGATKLGCASRPRGASWGQPYDAAPLCGIGFTMSLFKGGLAFAYPMLVDEVKIGVLAGSIL